MYEFPNSHIINEILLALTLVEDISMIISLCICFGMLYHLLNTKHHSEFQRIKKQLVSFFVMNILIVSSHILIEVTQKRQT